MPCLVLLEQPVTGDYIPEKASLCPGAESIWDSLSLRDLFRRWRAVLDMREGIVVECHQTKQATQKRALSTLFPPHLSGKWWSSSLE
jgi:hypothetical protein